jgi:hypothetical protein
VSGFEGELLLSPVRDTRGRPILQNGRTLWRHRDRFGFNGVFCEAGDLTDLASIPRPLWSIYPPDGEWVEAAVIHDKLYRTKGLSGVYTRKAADKLFLEAMKVLGVAERKRTVIYLAVRMGGQGGWGR